MVYFLPVFFPNIYKIGNILHIPVMGRIGHYLRFLQKDLGDQRPLAENEVKALLEVPFHSSSQGNPGSLL